jgi:hypothetical protein
MTVHNLNEYLLPPEDYQGHIVVKDYQIPFSARAWAEPQGAFHLEVQPLPLGEKNPAHLLLMQTMGQPGTANEEFRIECMSASGKKIESNRVALATYNHRSGELDVSFHLDEAKLTYKRNVAAQNPKLLFKLRGFRCFPQIKASNHLGNVLAAGSTKSDETFEITGLIMIEKIAECVVSDWRTSAKSFLDYLVTGLSFANGRMPSVPVIEYSSGTDVEIVFYNCGLPGAQGLAVQHFLNLQPIFSALVKSFNQNQASRNVLEMAMGWYNLDTTYDEIRFVSAMTAIEYLSYRSIPVEIRRAVQSNNNTFWRKVTARFRKPRWTLREGVELLLNYHGINTDEFSQQAISLMINSRNDIVHRGKIHDGIELWDQIVLAREIVARVVLKLVGFEGNYECFIGGGHTRAFPSLKRIK